ncbi:MAG: glycerol-3-phosphate 1-O-acyltransferase PlsY [Gemmatimonadota bacterium]
MNPLLLALLAYLVGSIPTSYIVSRWGYRVNLRERGSGNLGATNVYRVLGWKAALPVVLVDVGKGFVPTWLFAGLDPSPAWAWTLTYGGAAIVGHVFPVWLGFRGGKGVATSAGVLAAVAPLATLAGLVAWLVLVLGTRIVSVGSMAAAVVVAGVVWIRPPEEGGTVLRVFAPFLALFVLWAHRANVRRLIRGEENRFGSKSAASPPAIEKEGLE